MLGGSNGICGFYDAGSSQWICDSNINVNDGNWHFVSVTLSGQTITDYIDGGNSTSGTVSGTLS